MNRKLYKRPSTGSLVLTKYNQSAFYLQSLEQLSRYWKDEGWKIEKDDREERWQLLCPVSMMEWKDDS